MTSEFRLTPGQIETLRAAATAEHEAAHAEYLAEQRRLRDLGVSKRKASREAQGPRWRLHRAWQWLQELGEGEQHE